MGENPRPLEPRCLPNSTLVFKYLSSEIDNKIKVHTTNTAPDPCPNTAPVSKHCTYVRTPARREHQHASGSRGWGTTIFGTHVERGGGVEVEGGGCVCKQRMGLFDDVQSVG